MVKKELLALRPLNATPAMLKIEREDIPKKTSYTMCGRTYYEVKRKYSLFLRCRIEGNVLRVALYYPDHMRAGSRKPYYEVFIDRTARRFITYDRMAEKWLSAKVDRLEWPQYIQAYAGNGSRPPTGS